MCEKERGGKGEAERGVGRVREMWGGRDGGREREGRREWVIKGGVDGKREGGNMEKGRERKARRDGDRGVIERSMEECGEGEV